MTRLRIYLWHLRTTAQDDLRVLLTRALLRGVEKLNPNKDEGLSVFLHDMADEYARRPTGEWK